MFCGFGYGIGDLRAGGAEEHHLVRKAVHHVEERLNAHCCVTLEQRMKKFTFTRLPLAPCVLFHFQQPQGNIYIHLAGRLSLSGRLITLNEKYFQFNTEARNLLINARDTFVIFSSPSNNWSEQFVITEINNFTPSISLYYLEYFSSATVSIMKILNLRKR